MAPSVNSAPSVPGFDLNIELIESSDVGELINLTDDGCGSSCPNSCTTSYTD